MADIVQLGIAFDSDPLVRGVRKANASLKKLNKSQEQTAKATKLMANAVKAFAAFKVATGVITSLVQASEAFERSSAKLNSILATTGGVAGKTTDQLNAQARALEAMTGVNDNAIRNTQAVLLTFKSIQTDVFDSAIESILDLSAAFDTDLKGTAIQVGKALEDPIKGVGALAEVGVTFSEQQKVMIQRLVETGRTADAQRIILETLQGQIGGVAAGQNVGLVGAFTDLGNAVSDAREKLAQLPAIGGAISGFFTSLATSIRIITGTELTEIDKIFLSLEKLNTQLVEIESRSTIGPRGARARREKIEDIKDEIAVLIIRRQIIFANARAEDEAAAIVAASATSAAIAEREAAEATAAASVVTEEAAKLDEKRQKGIDSVIEALIIEAQTLGFTTTELLAYNLEKANATAEEIKQAIALQDTIDAYEEQQEAIEELAKAQEEQAEQAAKNAEKLQKAAEEAARAYEIAWTRSIENVQDALADGIFEMVRNGINSFEDFANTILDIFVRLAAEIVALKLFEILGGAAIASIGEPALPVGGFDLPSPVLFQQGGIVGAAATKTFKGAKSFQSGGIAGSSGVVPAILHRGEAVLRPDQLDSLSGGNQTINQTITFVINAIDAQGIDAVLQRSKGSIIKVIRDAVKRNPSTLRG